MRARELADVLPQLEHLHQLYQVLAKARQRRGAIDFDSREVKFRLAASGEVVQLGAEPRNDAHKLIEECMIAANVEAAKFLDKTQDSRAVSRARAAAGVQVRGPAGIPARIRSAHAAACTR